MAEYIERDSVQRLLDEIQITAIKLKGAPLPGLATLELKLHDLPTADVRPVVRGEWVQDLLASTGGGFYAVIRCSICGWAYPMIETHFCPCCGADMRKEGKP